MQALFNSAEAPLDDNKQDQLIRLLKDHQDIFTTK